MMRVKYLITTAELNYKFILGAMSASCQRMRVTSLGLYADFEEFVNKCGREWSLYYFAVSL